MQEDIEVSGVKHDSWAPLAALGGHPRVHLKLAVKESDPDSPPAAFTFPHALCSFPLYN